MAEIIRADFNGKSIISREQTDSAIKPGEQADIPANFIFGREMSQYLVDSLSDINLSYLRQLVYEVNEFDHYLLEFAELKDRELIDMLAVASEVDWQKKPAYYRALDQEIQNRIKSKNF